MMNMVKKTRVGLFVFIVLSLCGRCFAYDYGNDVNGVPANAVIVTNTAYSTLRVGYDTPNNVVTVISNATLSVASKTVVGGLQIATNNQLIVADGSTMTIGSMTNSGVSLTNGIFLGDDGSLTVGNNSTVSAESFFTGVTSNNSASTVVLSSNSVVAVSQDAHIGYLRSGSTVTIGGGSVLSVSNQLTVGTASNSQNVVNVNSGGILAVVSDASIVVNNEASPGANRNRLNVNSGGVLQIAGDADYDHVISQGVDINSGATLEVGGVLTDEDNAIDDGLTYRLNDSISTNTAGWATHSGSGVYIGSSTDGNGLEIVGGTVQSMDVKVVVGAETTAGNNKLTVSGPASRLNTATDIWVGGDGDNNTMSVMDGADVVVGGFLKTGVSGSASGNKVLVSGSNSTLTVSNAAFVGVSGSRSSLTISSNGTVYARSNVVVGVSGDSNEILVQAGGMLQVDSGVVIGQNGDTNKVTVGGAEGTNAVLRILQNLAVGDQGTGNRLTVGAHSDGFIAGDLIVGVSTGGNSVVVSGTNAFLAVACDATVGNSGVSNRLTVSSQANAVVSNLYVGRTFGADNNTVRVTGDDSRMVVSNNIYLGIAGGSNNAVHVENGGTLFLGGSVVAGGTNNLLNINGDGTLEVLGWDFSTASTSIVFNSGSTLGVGGTFADTTNAVDLGGFTLAIDGGISSAATARWTTTNTLYVGQTTDENTLSALDGGEISASNMVVGVSSNSINNTLLSSGTGAVIRVATDLTVGQGGSLGNWLHVKQSGSAAVGNNLVLGSSSGSNEAQIGDTGTTNVYGQSRLTVSSNLYVGYNGGSSNIFNIYSNGFVSVSNDAVVGRSADANWLILNATSAVLNVSGQLIVGDDGGSNNRLDVYSGTMNAMSDLIIGNSSNSVNNGAYLDGSNVAVNVSRDLIVGNYGAGNWGKLDNGAQLNVAADTYVGKNSKNNALEINGSNSLLNAQGNLFIGQQSHGGNALRALNGANVNVGRDLRLAGTNSVLQIDSVSTVTAASNYYQGAITTLRVGINSNTASLKVGGTASFENKSGIYLDTTGYGGTIGQSNAIQAKVVTASVLMVGGETATTYNLENLTLGLAEIFTNSLKKFSIYITNNTIVVDNFTELSISEAYGLTNGSAFVASTNIDRLYNATNVTAAIQRDILDELSSQKARKAMLDYYGEKESANPIHVVVNDSIGNVATRLSGRQGDVRSKMGLASGESGTAADPAVVSNQTQTLQGWMSGVGSWSAKSADGAFYGYDASSFGTLVGIDMMVNPNVLVGAAGGYTTASADKDNGATADASTRQAAFYMSVANEAWFFDSALVYGISSIEQDLGNIFDTTAEYDARNIAMYVGAGHQTVGKYLIVTPQAGLLANYYDQDAYTETSTNAIAREVDGFDALYLQSVLGCSVGMYMTVGEVTVRPDFRVRWLHEFNADEEDVGCNMPGGTDPMSMTLQSREADILQFGAGFAVKLSEVLECRLDADVSTFSGGSRYDLGGKLIYQF